jgi:hypothetical protein
MRVGQKVRFDPFEGIKFADVTALRGGVTGKIVAIYPKHKWFSVEYGNKQRTSFKFSDVGSVVTLIG